MFKELKETMEWATNKTKDNIIVELRKLQTEVAELKNLVDEIDEKLSEGFSSIVTAAEERICELQHEVQITSEVEQKVVKPSKSYHPTALGWIQGDTK